MKVQIKDLEPNPFRDMASYPVEDAKIQALVNSINETGFWDNVVVRKSPTKGKYQIAYGHHRWLALKKIWKPTDCADLPVRDLDDATMLRIMANENDSTWGINVKVDDETVRAAKKFLEDHPEITKQYIKNPKDSRLSAYAPGDAEVGVDIVSRFLGENWYRDRVARSIERLHLEAKGVLSRKAVNNLPTEGTARTFVKAVKDIKPTKQQQERVAERIKTAEKKDGLRDSASIRGELLTEKLKDAGIIKTVEKPDKTKDFIDVIKNVNQQMSSLSEKLNLLIQYQKDFDSDVYFKTIERMQFIATAQAVVRRLNTLLGGQNG